LAVFLQDFFLLFLHMAWLPYPYLHLMMPP
jgi:hypothetical protein